MTLSLTARPGRYCVVRLDPAARFDEARQILSHSFDVSV